MHQVASSSKPGTEWGYRPADFFGTGCVAALKAAGTRFGLWEISIIWGVGVSMAIGGNPKLLDTVGA